MNVSLEQHKVSTTDRLFSQINSKSAKPVGIVLLGVDCAAKEEFCQEIIKHVPLLEVNYTGLSCVNNGLEDALRENRPAMIVMSGDDSHVELQREDRVRLLHNLGAQTVIGIWVRYESMTLLHAADACAPLSDEDIKQREQMLGMQYGYPTAQEFDLFFECNTI